MACPIVKIKVAALPLTGMDVIYFDTLHLFSRYLTKLKAIGRAPFSEMRGIVLHHMGIAGFSALIVAAPVAVTARVVGVQDEKMTSSICTGCSRKQRDP